MARRTHVPKFGNWDANEHLPYTAVFDHAREGRGRPINPNDPSQNPSMFPGGSGGAAGAPAPAPRAYTPGDPDDPLEVPDRPLQRQQQQNHQERTASQPGSREGSSRGGGGGQQERPASRDGNGTARGQYQQQAPARRPPTGASSAAAAGNGRVGPGDPKREAMATGGGMAQDQSPSHPAGRGTRLGAASPAWETRRKSTSSEDGQAVLAPNTPNRSRLRPLNNAATREEAAGRGPTAALPKFGAWDAQDPQSGDGFTVIFNNARNEKKTGGPVNIPRTPDYKADLYEPTNTTYTNKGHGHKKKWLCCLG